MASVVLVEEAATYTHVAVRGRLDGSGVDKVDLPLTSQTVARGVGLAVIVGNTPVRHVLELTNVASLIPLVETRDAALQALGLSAG